MKKDGKESDAGGVILVAEDDENDALILSRACQKAGLRIRLRFVENGMQLMDYMDGSGKYSDREKCPSALP